MTNILKKINGQIAHDEMFLCEVYFQIIIKKLLMMK